jgi:hypothetical protein
MISLRTFAVATIVLSLLVLGLEITSLILLPDFAAQFERSKRQGDPELQNIEIRHWQRMAALNGAIAIALAVPFVIAGAALLSRRPWGRTVFVWSAVGVLLFMGASCMRYVDTAQLLHVLYAAALLTFGWWFLYRSHASAALRAAAQSN